MKNSLIIGALTIVIFATLLPVGNVFAAEPGRGNLFYNGTVVGTIIPPAAFPHQGIDNFYKVTNGASGQLGIASVAPRNPDYHGGHWKVFTVTFENGVTPFLLTSEAAVLSAQTSGMATVTRVASADFLCPIHP